MSQSGKTPAAETTPQKPNLGKRIVRVIFAVLSIFFTLFFRTRTTVLGLLLCIAGVIALFTEFPHYILPGLGLLALGLAFAGFGYWSSGGR